MARLMPRVSVLLTTYNRPAMLREAVDSVLAQTFTDFELIVLDDNSSSPAQWDVLADYRDAVVLYKSGVQPAERPERVRYAVLANIGLGLARGEYVTYLCDDDWYLPRRLEVMAARLDEGGCQVVYGSQRVVRDGAEQFTRPAAHILPKASMVVDHSSVMHTRQAGLDAGGWDEDRANWRHADATFWDRLTGAGHWFYPAGGGEVLDVHRYHAGSVSEAGIPA
jgi:spore maturation protein CgeD